MSKSFDIFSHFNIFANLHFIRKYLQKMSLHFLFKFFSMFFLVCPIWLPLFFSFSLIIEPELAVGIYPVIYIYYLG